MKKWFSLSVVLFAVVLTAACPKDTPFGKAAKAGLDITDVIHSASIAVDQLRINGTISKEDEKQTLQYFQAINNLDVNVYGPCVEAAHLAGDQVSGFVACATSMTNSVQDPGLLASFHITNPQSQLKAQQTAQAVSNLLQIVVQLKGK